MMLTNAAIEADMSMLAAIGLNRVGTSPTRPKSTPQSLDQ
jgi:hypothetical protein